MSISSVGALRELPSLARGRAPYRQRDVRSTPIRHEAGPAPFLTPRLYRIPCVIGAGFVALFFAADWIAMSDAFGLIGSQVVALFHPGLEKTVAAWYQSALLLACAALVHYVGERLPGHGERFRIWWRVLAIGLAYMSVDEAAELHERLSILVPSAWHHGPLVFAWVLPAMIAVAAVAPFYIRFLRELPPPARSRLLVAAIVYLGAAFGLEMLGATLHTAVPEKRLVHWVVIAEETTELLGLLLALRALVYLAMDVASSEADLAPREIQAAPARLAQAR